MQVSLRPRLVLLLEECNSSCANIRWRFNTESIEAPESLLMICENRQCSLCRGLAQQSLHYVLKILNILFLLRCKSQCMKAWIVSKHSLAHFISIQFNHPSLNRGALWGGGDVMIYLIQCDGLDFTFWDLITTIFAWFDPGHVACQYHISTNQPQA